MLLNRRSFCTRSALLAAAATLPPLTSAQTYRLDVAAIDHDSILSEAHRYILLSPDPITAHPAPNSPGTPHDFFSEDSGNWPDNSLPPSTVKGQSLPSAATLFTAHREVLLKLSLAVPALTAASVLLHTSDPAQSRIYSAKAADHLQAWFIVPETRMAPSLNYGLVNPAKPAVSRFEGIIEAIQLVEVAQSIPFLLSSDALSPADTAALFAWFADYLTWLNTSRLAGLARDQRNHDASSWLLQACSCSFLQTFNPIALKAPAGQKPEDLLNPLRHLYRASTLRSQIFSDGTFPHELTTPWPYRLSLFNLDMLAAICLLLSTRFDSLWDYNLQDGPGMRVAIARHYPYMLNRGTWPYPADLSRFTELPLRQPSLLFSARAYERPEYATLWHTLPSHPTDPILYRTFPIRQPLLWTIRPQPSA